jgi:predicted oxidoreductase
MASIAHGAVIDSGASPHNNRPTARRGIKTDAHARALDADGRVIAGLYAAGNDMASIMGGNYPGAGITLGPALTFGYIAGRHLADGAASA